MTATVTLYSVGTALDQGTRGGEIILCSFGLHTAEKGHHGGTAVIPYHVEYTSSIHAYRTVENRRN